MKEIEPIETEQLMAGSVCGLGVCKNITQVRLVTLN
jgi:hypothetical protein